MSWVAAAVVLSQTLGQSAAFQNAPLFLAASSCRGAAASTRCRHPGGRRESPRLSPGTAAQRGRARDVLGGLRASAVSDVKAAQLRLDAFELLEVGGLTADEANGLMGIADIRFARPGDVLKQNDAITSSAYQDEVLFIVSGSADILQAGEVAREVGPGDFVGESEYLQLEVAEKLNALTIDPVEQFFKLADKDKSGAVDAAELQAMLYVYGVNLDIEQARKLVSAIDKNDDGAVSLPELRALTDSVQERTVVRDMFLKIDKDGSGAVDARELALTLKEYLQIDLTPVSVLAD
jgi:Ca2+-binding EF-hand superfamily protein